MYNSQVCRLSAYRTQLLGFTTWVAIRAQLLQVATASLSCSNNLSLSLRPEFRQEYGPNLSILISPGKENNCDSLSNGE